MAACSDETPTTAPAVPVEAGQEALANVHRDAPSSSGWMTEARTLVGQANMSPLAAGRVYAAVGIAQYQAVSGVDGNRHGKKGKDARLERRRGAVAGASAVVLSFLFPSAATALEARIITVGTEGSGSIHPQFERGVEAGRAAGAAIVEHLKNDRFTVPWTGTVPTGPGMWIANGTPAGGTFGGVTPYFLNSASQFRPVPPPAWGSAAFLTDLAEIRALSDTRTPEQQAIALQWNYPTGSPTPPGYWNEVASNYIAEKGLDERAAARVYAFTGGAVMDALIACWEAKYHYWLIRPSQADPAITLSFGLPNHPSYPSGHSCVSASAATVLTAFFPRHRKELDAQVDEAGLSRMYAGIHYRFDISAGKKLGVDVARWALRHKGRID
jgi:hypothetical protein